MNNNHDPMEHLRPKELGDLPIPDEHHMRTQALFFEFIHKSKSKTPPIYTLKCQDHTNNGTTYRSIYQLYMSCNTEYEAAMLILGSWPHWEKLCKCVWFMEELEKWRREMELRDGALAHDVLVKLTEKGNVTAAKALKSESTKNKVGRPKRGGGRTRDKDPVSDDLEELLSHAEKRG